MEMGIVVTAFYLLGMLGLVIFNEALADEPTPDNQAKPKPRTRTAHASAEARAHKKAA